jgi:ribose/xylose/arabinose/galactoside ABC-type transport system permease subunit
MCLLFSQLSPVFATRQNWTNISEQISVVMIIGSAFTLLMVSGEFDLSVGAVSALAGVVAATLSREGVPLPLAFAAGVGLGAAIGWINGLLVVWLRINSLIATIGMLYMVRGSANLISGGVSVVGMPRSYENLGNYIWLGVPVVVPTMILFVVVFAVIQRSTVLGQHAIASGSNPQAAFLAGVPVHRTKWVFFVLTGAAAAYGGLVISSQFAAGLPSSGVGLEFEVIVAAVVGGTSLFGGQGRVLGTLLGVLIIGVLNNGLDLLRVRAYWQTVALGIVLVVAVGIDAVLQRFNPGKALGRLGAPSSRADRDSTISLAGETETHE